MTAGAHHYGAASVAVNYCTGTTKDGRRCRRLVLWDRYSQPFRQCFQHRPLSDIEQVSTPAEPVPNIGDTCCGNCPGGTCYVDGVTGA